MAKDLDQILNDLRSATTTEKVAEDKTDKEETKSEKETDSGKADDKSSDPKDSLKKSIEKLKDDKDGGDGDGEGSEKEASVVNGLTKIAQEIAESDNEHLVKLGQVYGAAACDGFMARYNEYAEAGAFDSQGGEKVAFEKNAEEEKIAFAQGYHDTMTVLQNALANGDAGASTEKTAEDVFVKEAQEGYEAATEFFIKVAQDTYNRGYADCQKLIESL